MVLKSILPHRAPGIAKTSALQMRFDRPGGTCLQLECWYCAPVAQLDRAFASGAKGRWFESTRAYHIPNNLHAARWSTTPTKPPQIVIGLNLATPAVSLLAGKYRNPFSQQQYERSPESLSYTRRSSRALNGAVGPGRPSVTRSAGNGSQRFYEAPDTSGPVFRL